MLETNSDTYNFRLLSFLSLRDSLCLNLFLFTVTIVSPSITEETDSVLIYLSTSQYSSIKVKKEYIEKKGKV